MGKMKVVRRDFYKKNLRISPIPKIYIRSEYINLIIDISLINEIWLFCPYKHVEKKLINF